MVLSSELISRWLLSCGSLSHKRQIKKSNHHSSLKKNSTVLFIAHSFVLLTIRIYFHDCIPPQFSLALILHLMNMGTYLDKLLILIWWKQIEPIQVLNLNGFLICWEVFRTKFFRVPKQCFQNCTKIYIKPSNYFFKNWRLLFKARIW